MIYTLYTHSAKLRYFHIKQIRIYVNVGINIKYRLNYNLYVFYLSIRKLFITFASLENN